MREMLSGERPESGAVTTSTGIRSGRPRALSLAVALFRWVTFAATFSAAAFGVWWAAQHAVQVAGIRELPLGFGLHDSAQRFSERVSADPTANRLVMVGDSTLETHPGMKRPKEQSLPGCMERNLAQFGDDGRFKLHDFHMPGLGPVGMYFVNEQLIAARPDRVLLALNLRSFSRDSMRESSYAESAGWMSAGRVVEALGQPIFATGLTADRLLLYKAIVTLHADELWRATRQLQARAFKLYDPTARWVDAAFGTQGYEATQKALGFQRWFQNMLVVEDRPRFTRPRLERILGPVFRGLRSDHPNLQLLETALAHFREAHIPVTVYIEPFNIEHARSVDASLDGLSRSLRAIRRTVKSQGAELWDLHALLAEDAFRDAGDHYTFDDKSSGTCTLARRLAKKLAKRDRDEKQAMTTVHAVP